MYLLYILGKFKIGNFELISTENQQILSENASKQQELLLGVVNDVNKPIVKVYIKNKDKFFTSICDNLERGFGESYMEGVWYSDNLLEFLTILVLNQHNEYIPKFNVVNFYSKSLSSDKQNIKSHYDVGNDFYQTFLTDKLSTYSCGFWKNELTTLDEAQHNKVNIIISKLRPEPNKTILDIGAGWGKIASYVSEVTKCHVTGITISDEQAKFASESYNQNNVIILNMDYRLLSKQFDYIYSIGMFEHVRYENYDEYFSIIKKCLKPNGRFLLHTILNLEPSNPSILNDSFVSKHIFPGGQFPTNDWITDAVFRSNLNIIHTEFYGGQHYAKTLNTWNKNMLEKSDYIVQKYDMELLKKYEYYFNICEAMFRCGTVGIGHYLITNEQIVSLDNNYACGVV